MSPWDNDWVQVGVAAIAASAVVGLGGVVALQLLGRGSVRLLAWIAPITATVAVVVGVLTTANLMFLSQHDLLVVLVVCLTAGAVALGFGLLLAHRIGQLERQSRELAEERARSEEAERTRRELIAWISHDLRTPLASIRAMAEALEDGVATDPERYQQHIRRETDRLARMVDDLFEVSRVNSGTLGLARERAVLTDVVGEVVKATAPVATAKGVRVESSSDAMSGEPVVSIDSEKLERAIGNLITNAIRHTPHDGVVRVQTSLDQGYAYISVSDQCGGIPERDLHRIFEPGYRGDTARTPGAGDGAGLGLAIVQGVVSAHQGVLEVANSGAGCLFEIRLPAVPDARAAVHELP
ncbi:MAG TPA: HAMP domain-containing sensor histidine kinase [Actinomycetes bacterium]|nr:HAMP domain-containing sensor histidine kinase [Actinomycetes bacterium]